MVSDCRSSSHLSALELVQMVGLPQPSLPGVSVLPVDVDEDVGVASGPHHVSREDADLIRVF